MKTILTTAALLLLAVPAMAQPEQPQNTSGRYEIWMGITGWPGMSDLRPLAAGEFDEVGFGIGAAAHGTVRRFEHSDLMVGIDGYVAGTASNVSGTIDDLMARDLYLGGSVKWALGQARNLQLDAGLGYHLLDMAQVSTRVFGLEHQAWESNRLATFVGATWDVRAGHENRRSGLSLAFKVHFVEFSTVRDEEVFLAPLLGPDAGRLEGPIYLLQVGYYSR